MQALGLTTLVGLVTITVSTYMILYSQPLYVRLAPWLGPFERRKPFRELAMERVRRDASAVAAIVFGAGRFGRRLVEQLRARELKVLAVDFDPETVRTLRQKRVPVLFGDAENGEFVGTLPLATAKWVVSTLPEAEVNAALLQALHDNGFAGKVAMAVRGSDYGQALARRGVARVFRPYDDAADFAAREIADALARDNEMVVPLDRKE
ncbi:MAG: NAD-binding protein [Comamonadaceae bacterium]|nr:NAD-binding protein [Comamonadaceae bacterium]